MNHSHAYDISIISTMLLGLCLISILLSVPLILRRVKMNKYYGVRIPEAFRSPQRWLQINHFGGMLLLAWGMAVGITGGVGFLFEPNQWLAYTIIAASVVLGGMMFVTIGIFVYAARTNKP
jgi:hypothetical protein